MRRARSVDLAWGLFLLIARRSGALFFILIHASSKEKSGKQEYWFYLWLAQRFTQFSEKLIRWLLSHWNLTTPLHIATARLKLNYAND